MITAFAGSAAGEGTIEIITSIRIERFEAVVASDPLRR